MFNSEVISLGISVFCGFGGMIWKIAKAEDKIIEKIAKDHNFLLSEINDIKHEIDKLKIINSNEHENFSYRDHALNETLNHKFKRIESWIDQITSHLEKNGSFLLKKNYLAHQERDKD